MCGGPDRLPEDKFLAMSLLRFAFHSPHACTWAANAERSTENVLNLSGVSLLFEAKDLEQRCEELILFFHDLQLLTGRSQSKFFASASHRMTWNSVRRIIQPGSVLAILLDKLDPSLDGTQVINSIGFYDQSQV